MTNSQKVSEVDEGKGSIVNSYNAFLRRFYPDTTKFEKASQHEKETTRANSPSLETGGVWQSVHR